MLNPFEKWRSDEKPTFKSNPAKPQVEGLLCSEDLQADVRAHCLQQYQKAMQLMEHSVADVSLKYVSRNPSSVSQAPFADKFRHDGTMKSENKSGALLHFVNAYCQRYLDLHEAYAAWEMDKKIPMIPVTAGQMKLHGFTSEDIIKMKDDCAKYSEITDNIKTILKGNTVAYEKVIAVMASMKQDEISLKEFINDPNKREIYLTPILGSEAAKVGAELAEEFKKYETLSEIKLLNLAHLLMHDFGHMEYTDIAMQLYYVGIMHLDSKKSLDKLHLDPNAEQQARILMEIRHRIGGDMSIHQNSPGTLGGNPLAYLNMLKRGEPGNPEAEFREKMYFVYMNNHFANAVIRDQERIDYINDWLEKNKKGWKLDPEFIAAMKKRGAQYIPPIFRYGANAALNKQLREIRSHEEMEQFYRENPNISVKEVMEGLASIDAYYRLKLSDRELFNQIGELRWNPDDLNRTDKQLNFGTGAAVFKLFEKINNNMDESAKEYLNAVNDLGIPVFAGISGTLDQSTTMAGLVGLAVDKDDIKRNLELETIKLAYLAFMLPGRDHSAHEILQSSTTFGLDYVAGPGYQQYIYPPDKDFIIEEIKKEQERRSSQLPEYYLSAEYAEKVMEEILAKKSQTPVVKQTPVIQPSTTSITSPTTPTTTTKNHYIAIPLFGSEMAKDFKGILKEDKSITMVNPHDLHITIGWLTGEITPEMQQKMNKALSPILAKYADLAFSYKHIEVWEDVEVIIMLNDDSKQLSLMRAEIKKALEELKIPFDSQEPHFKIAYTDQPKTWTEIEPFINEMSSKKSYSFNHCGLMHFDIAKWRTAIDYDYGFQSHADEQARAIHKLHRREQKYAKRTEQLLHMHGLQKEKSGSRGLSQDQIKPSSISTNPTDTKIDSRSRQLK